MIVASLDVELVVVSKVRNFAKLAGKVTAPDDTGFDGLMEVLNSSVADSYDALVVVSKLFGSDNNGFGGQTAK